MRERHANGYIHSNTYTQTDTERKETRREKKYEDMKIGFSISVKYVWLNIGLVRWMKSCSI
jgi:hypothetical protein